MLGALIWMAAVGLDAVSAFELPGDARIIEHEFQSQGHRLSGSLMLPPLSQTPPIVLIVHGDGPQDRWSDTTYLPMVNAFLAAGIGVFSWDKPGVGQSTGDWLAQSMQDRTQEAVAAFNHLHEQAGIPHKNLGFLGFSQAGWVVPRAAFDVNASYSVLIGPAVNWRTQGAYYTTKRLEKAGIPADEIEINVARNLAENDAIFGADGDCTVRDDLSVSRCAFAKRNYGADATAAILAMTTPALVLVGAEDLNVNPEETATVYARNARHDVRIVPEATHSLLQAAYYNFQTPADWTQFAGLRFMMSGPRAYAPDVLDQITRWIVVQPR